MKTSRRGFLAGSAAALSLLGTNKLLANNEHLKNANTSGIINPSPEKNELILPPPLKKGSKVAITAPASPTSIWEIANTVNLLKKLGCTVEIGDTIKNRQSKFHYFSASDDERACEFMHFIERKDISCILCGRGGYGVMRILPSLDYTTIRENPKIIVGFSDITALLNAVYYKSNVVSFHGPVACLNFSQFTKDNFIKLLFDVGSFKPIVNTFPTAQAYVAGTASGRLIGGNLSMLVSTLGTPYEIDTKDSILFIEEISEEPYKIDKMLTQLWLAGKFQDCCGIILGKFTHLDSRRNFWPVTSFTLRYVLETRFKSLGIPCMTGLPIGHDSTILTLPIGINASFDTKKKTFTILEPPVNI